MAHKEKKEIAIALRKEGMSYRQIKEVVSVSKSTLSGWLNDYPLSVDRMKELRDNNPQRIENFRRTMKTKRDARIYTQEVRAINDIKKISQREMLVSGFFLFWGEGSKGRSGEVSLANTDPLMIRAFIKWLLLLQAKKEKFRFTLHLYNDMDVQKELTYWSNVLEFPLSVFRKPYIKSTNQSDITYKNGFGHGTCSVRYMSQELNDYVRMGLKYVRHLYET